MKKWGAELNFTFGKVHFSCGFILKEENKLDQDEEKKKRQKEKDAELAKGRPGHYL